MIFGSNFQSTAQDIKIFAEGSQIEPGSVIPFELSSLDTEEIINIDIENNSNQIRTFTITREKIINPTSWTITKSTWELDDSDAFRYPGSDEISWTTFNPIETQFTEKVQFQDFLMVSNDSCALY